MTIHNATRFFYSFACGLMLAACDGPQSALAPAGEAAERIAGLFWWMTGFAAVIWIAVIVLALYAVGLPAERHNRRRSNVLIVGGGAVVPTIVVAVLAMFGLAPIPALLAPAPEGSLRITISGEQWWWRVRYQHAEDESVVLANEIRLPVGEPVEFRLESPDVIHSFWIPSLGGKIDMIPGRVTRLALTPTKTGVFRGACAEYCGTAHALMNFTVVVEEKAAFDRWLAHQRTPASIPNEPARATRPRAFSRQRLRRLPPNSRHARQGRDRTRFDPRRQPAQHRRWHAAEQFGNTPTLDHSHRRSETRRSHAVIQHAAR